MSDSLDRDVATSSSSSRSTVQLVYILYAVGFFTGITYIVGGIIAILKKSDEQNSVMKSHFSYQARTFWFSVLWSVLGIATALIIVGYIILIANGIWVLYRLVKGWLAFSEGKAIQ